MSCGMQSLVFCGATPALGAWLHVYKRGKMDPVFIS